MPHSSKPNDSTSNHLIAYTDKEVAGNRSVFRRIGVAFPHKSGVGFNVELDALPCDGRIVVLPPKDSQDDPGQEDAQKPTSQ